jgi:hypothetical protein
VRVRVRARYGTSEELSWESQIAGETLLTIELLRSVEALGALSNHRIRTHGVSPGIAPRPFFIQLVSRQHEKSERMAVLARNHQVTLVSIAIFRPED